MQRICRSLSSAGYKVTLLGRELVHSVPLSEQVFEQKRLLLWFKRGKLFYIEYNIRLFFHLLTHSYDIYGATDLDTLLPHFLVSRIKGKQYVYDAHEYFAELPEIVERPLVRFAWKSLERLIVPRTKFAYTINQTYANLFMQEYGTKFAVIRNATVLRPLPNERAKSPKECYILYQGAVNVGRGIEQMIEAMQWIECKLYVCGDGDVLEQCRQLAKDKKVTDKVHFWGWIAPDRLIDFTQNATLGFTFFTEQGKSYYYSLANRFFDYFHNGIPQLCIDYPEYRHVNEQFEIAVLLNHLDPKTIADAANNLLRDSELYAKLHQNCLKARESINWQTEEKKLIDFYNNIKL